MRTTTLQVLRLLADANFRSGTDLGRALGITRAAVWNAVRDLEERGLPFDKVRGRGYRLAEPVELLDADAVNALLAGRDATVTLDVIDECASTNTLLMERALAGAASGTAIACEEQTAGRGRRGNAWHAAVGGGLAFSLLWRFTGGAATLAGLSLAVGVACVRACERLDIAGVRLKWPNDLIHDGAKLGGILIELSGDALGPTSAVIGIGLNVRLPADFEKRIDQTVTDLATMAGNAPSRNALLAALLAENARVLREFERAGFAAFRDEWTRHHAYRDQPVTLTRGDGARVNGRAVGIAENGALVIETGDGIERFHSGDVSLRPASALAGQRAQR